MHDVPDSAAFGCVPDFQPQLRADGEWSDLRSVQVGYQCPDPKSWDDKILQYSTFARQVKETHGDAILSKNALASMWWGPVHGFRTSRKDSM